MKALIPMLVLLLAACGDGGGDGDVGGDDAADGGGTGQVSGYVELWPDDEIRQAGMFYEPGKPCDGNVVVGPDDLRIFGAEFEGFDAGAEVTVKNQDGSVVGAGQLDEGEWVAEDTNTNLSDHLLSTAVLRRCG